jgi:hypothetical protein
MESPIESVLYRGTALQAAEKLNFPEGVENESRQDAPGTIREA